MLASAPALSKRSLLRHGFLLNRTKVGQRIWAGIIVEGVAPHEARDIEHGIRTQNVRPRGRNVEGLDLGALIGWADQIAIRSHHAIVQVVVRVRCLEPGAREAEVEMQSVRLRQLVIEAVENVLLVATRVEDDKLRRVQKAPGVEPVGRDEVPPVLAAVGEISIQIGTAEGAIAGRDAAMRRGRTQAGACRHIDHQAGLVAELCGRRTRDHRHRLHGVKRNLVGKYFALLIGNRLTIEGKRILLHGHPCRETGHWNRRPLPAKPA